jgi:SAM-dependent methyltransferase
MAGETGCRVCLAAGRLKRFEVLEMMFGTREAFTYELCNTCGSVQIVDVPIDLSRHYPPDYYAHSTAETGWRQRLKKPLVTLRNALLLRAPEPAFKLLSTMPGVGYRMRTHPFRSLRIVRLQRNSRLVDVGGGSGLLLGALSDLGFGELTCIDPYVSSPKNGGDIRFIRSYLADVKETFDLIMYHHSLEHVVDLDGELAAIRASLTPDGFAVVRMPTLPNVAFDTYGPNWVQLDAPRHIHIPSRKGFSITAGRCGLHLIATGDDSTEFQFWGSEEYARGVALTDSRFVRNGTRAFSRRKLRELRKRARAANAEGRGDQAWFILRRGENRSESR